MPHFIVSQHPLVQHKLTLLRDKRTPTIQFRALLREIGMLLAYEATSGLRLTEMEIETPFDRMQGQVLAGPKLCLVSVLRAGNGLLDGMLEVLPNARVGHVGLYRDPETLEAVEYYARFPEDMRDRDIVVVDPMLATGHTAISAVSRVLRAGGQRVTFVCLIAAPEGLQAFHDAHPDVPVIAAALDLGLDAHGYIHPGLGDAGDRLFGT